MRTLVAQVIVVAMLAGQSPVQVLDGACADAHEIPQFVLDRVELPYGAFGDCPQNASRGPSCPALGVPDAGPEHASTARACLPGE